MTEQVGAIKAKMELDARGFNAELQKAKQNLSDSANEAKRVNKDFKQVTRALLDIGMSGKEIRKVQQEFRDMHPEVLEQQLKHLEVQLRRVGATDEQIGRIKSKMTEVQQETAKTESRTQALNSAITALGANAALIGLLRTIKSLTDEAQRMTMAYQGLTELSKSLNIDVSKSTGLVQELADKGFMSVTEAANAVKTALASGLNLDETRKLILSLADAAAYNRQANYGWGESVVVTMQGIKQGMSTLTDAVGVTTNLSTMYDRYAKSIGTTAGKLTDAQKIQAAYNGFIQESGLYAGNADKAMQGYNGSQAHFNQTMQIARATLGESFMPILQQLMDKISPIIRDFTVWAANNKDVVAGIAAATVTITGLIAGLTTLIAVLAAVKLAFVALELAMGPAGWFAVGITILLAGLVAYKSSVDATSESVFKFAKNQDELNAKLAQSPLSRSTEDVKNLQSDMEKINTLVEQRKELEAQLADMNEKMNQTRASGDNAALFKMGTDLSDVQGKLNDVNKQLSILGINTPDDAPKVLADMNRQVKEALPALVELERQSMRETIAHADTVKQMKDLSKQYDDLNSKSKHTAEQNASLTDIVKRLKEQYPDLIVELDKENQWHIKNKDALDQYISGESNRVKAAGDAAVTTLKIAKKEAEERVRLATAAMEEIRRLENKQKPKPASFLPDSVNNLLGIGFDSTLDSTKKNLNDTINTGQFSINEASKVIRDISTDNYDAFRTPVVKPAADKPKKGKTADQIQQEQYQIALKVIEQKRTLNKISDQQELASLENLAVTYKKNATIRGDLEVKIYQLKQQIAADTKQHEDKAAKDRFDASKEWIDQEERRMTLAGKSENEIAQMKLDAWTRVRNRQKKDTVEDIQFYKDADTQVYQNRLSLMKQAEAAEKAMSSKLQTTYSKAMNDALKQGDEDLKNSLAGIDGRIKDANDSATEQTKRLQDAIAGVNDELQQELGIFDAQIKALDQAKQQDDRGKATDDHNARMKALQDQKTWLEQNGQTSDPFAVAALDRQMGDEQKTWAEQQKQWQLDDERARLEGLKAAAQQRADVRKKELEDQIQKVQDWKDIQVAALNDEKQRLQDHWNNEKEGIRAIMDNGLLQTIADMAAHDPGFKARGESMIQSLLDGIASKKSSLESEISAIQSLVGSVSGVSVSSSITMPSTISSSKNAANSTNTSTGTISGSFGAALAAALAAMPKSIILNNNMDGKEIASHVIPIVGKQLSQPVRAQ